MVIMGLIIEFRGDGGIDGSFGRRIVRPGISIGQTNCELFALMG
jgi:hypothetical protein